MLGVVSLGVTRVSTGGEGYTVLHVNIGMPCRQLNRVEAVHFVQLTVPALHILSQVLSLAAMALGSQNSTFAGHCKCIGIKLVSSMCVVGRSQQGLFHVRCA